MIENICERCKNITYCRKFGKYRHRIPKNSLTEEKIKDIICKDYEPTKKAHQ